jgi:hypothetical protein
VSVPASPSFPPGPLPSRPSQLEFSPFNNTQVPRISPPAFLCLPSPHAWFCSWTVLSPQKICCAMPGSLHVQRVARKATPCARGTHGWF